MDHLPVDEGIFSFISSNTTLILNDEFIEEIAYNIHVFTISMAISVNVKNNKIYGIPNQVPAFPGCPGESNLEVVVSLNPFGADN